MGDLRTQICPNCRSIHSELEDCRDYVNARKYMNGHHDDIETRLSLDAAAETFVESVEVVTEYERGLKDGILRRETLAADVMEFTAKVEQHNINLDIENQWLRYQRAGWMAISICFFIALMFVTWK